jgi:hypothetical protein
MDDFSRQVFSYEQAPVSEARTTSTGIRQKAETIELRKENT